jgi:DNA-binding MarR family transcriptional regulator
MVSLARSLHCHDSNVTGLVDRLEQRGLIERQSNPNDRRVKLIALTPDLCVAWAHGVCQTC